jgi:hypothetical protein
LKVRNRPIQAQAKSNEAINNDIRFLGLKNAFRIGQNISRVVLAKRIRPVNAFVFSKYEAIIAFMLFWDRREQAFMGNALAVEGAIFTGLPHAPPRSIRWALRTHPPAPLRQRPAITPL